VPHILLTGAGFSRNWGGWLANEVFEYLLGSVHIDDPLRRRMWVARERQQGFEDVLAELQDEFETRRSNQVEQDLLNLTNAVSMMFAEMGAGYDQINFEPQNDIAMMVTTFLQRFDAIYTLNQDTLIEQKYVASVIGGCFSGCTLPGIKSGNSAVLFGKTEFKLFGPDPTNFNLSLSMQPYIKLHGSFNWMQDRDRLLIVGGNKAANIQKHPLLAWYHTLFQTDLSKPKIQLMIIGYSFNDSHINKYLLDAVEKNDLKIFIIDPLGVDVLDKRNPATPESRTELLEKLAPSVIGASRRPLTATFNHDRVEHRKVMKFF
jgi:hypothetical protein